MNVDDDLEDVRPIRVLGAEKLPTASYALLPNLKKRSIYCHRRGTEISSSPVIYTAAPKRVCIRRLAGARHVSPPHATGHFVNTVTRGSVGAPNERSPFRFHGAVVGFVDRCLSKTRNLAGSN